MYSKNIRRLSLFGLIFVAGLALVVLSELGLVRADDPVTAPPGLAIEPGPPLLHILGADDQDAWEWEVIRLVNQERAKPENGGLPPLKFNANLQSAARAHGQDMGDDNYFAHDSYNYSDGSWTYLQNWSDRIRTYYTGAPLGENIAAGYSSPAGVMSIWMGSSSHRDNILGTGYTEIGIGYYYDASDSANIFVPPNQYNMGPYYHYWVQNFGRRPAVYPVVINREAYSTTNRTVQLYVYGPGSGQMRFSNDGVNWSDWKDYSTSETWDLAAGGTGVRTVYAEINDGSQIYSASDDIYYVTTAPVLSVAPKAVTFFAKQGTGTCLPTINIVRVSNTGGGSLDWEASESSDWFDIATGTDTVLLTCVSNVVDDYGVGKRTDTLTVSDPGALDSPQTVSATLIVVSEIYATSLPLVMHNHGNP